MKVDMELIQAKIDIIEQNLGLLEEIKKMDLEDFTNSYRDIQASKHALQESIEACLDIANHVISTYGYRRPEDYKDIFRVLMERDIIKKDFFVKLEQIAKFRNLLVHRYEKLETKKLHQILEKDLGDIRFFVKTILKFLKSRAGDR